MITIYALKKLRIRRMSRRLPTDMGVVNPAVELQTFPKPGPSSQQGQIYSSSYYPDGMPEGGERTTKAMPY